MTAEAIKIDESSVRKLLGAASPDAALLYIYVFSGNNPANAQAALHLTPSRLACATATAAFITERASRHSIIRMDGGDLDITLRETDNHILMTGPATTVFQGRIE